MWTGRSAASTCTARAALAGNPSDGYGGAVVAVPVPDLCAMATAREADALTIEAADPALGALLAATAAAFEAHTGELPAVALSASTEIPRSVGLAGSSALVIATLRVLAAWAGRRWEPVELARLALAVERERPGAEGGVEGGLEDRLVQAVGRPVAMRFAPLWFEVLAPPDQLHVFVAWAPAATRPSDAVQRSLRRRFDGGDERVRAAMAALAGHADDARRALAAGDAARLAAAMDASFDLRASVAGIDEHTREMAALGRAYGAAVNSAGAGGSIVGLVRSAAELDALAVEFAALGVRYLPVEIA